MDNSECFGVKFVKIYPEMTSQYLLFLNMVLVAYIVGFFICANTFGHIVTYCIYILDFKSSIIYEHY